MDPLKKDPAEFKLPDRPIPIDDALLPAAQPSRELNIQSDISRILEEAKLPERREVTVGITPQKVDPTPSPLATPAPPVPQTPESAPRDSLVSLHTLKDDLQALVKEKKMSLVRAAALEEDKRAHHDHEPEHIPGRKTGKSLLLALTLVIFGSAALFSVIAIMNERATSSASLTDTPGLIFSEQAIPLSTDNQSPNSLKRAMAESRNAALTLGAILRVVPVLSETVDERENVRETLGQEFVRRFGLNMPDTLYRALNPEFFFGIHTVDENAPLMIFTINSYERAFAGMLEWEETMNTDLTPMFTGVPSLTRASDGALGKRTFSDVVIRNYDVRALKDDAGVIQLYYTFPTRDILIIAESPYSFNEILSRLRAERRI